MIELNDIKQVATANFKNNQGQIFELMRSTLDKVEIDLNTLHILNDVTKADLHFDSDFSRELVTGLISDKDFLTRLSSLLGLTITGFVRKALVDVIIYDRNHDAPYREHLSACEGETEFEMDDYKKFGYSMENCFFLNIQWGDESKTVDVAQLFDSELLPHVIEKFSFGISVEDVVFATRDYLKVWNGALLVNMFHKGYVKAREEMRAKQAA